MSKITFTLEVEPEEVAEVVDACWDVVQDFGLPAYEIHTQAGGTLTSRVGGGDRKRVDLPPVDSFAEWAAAAFPEWALDDEQEDETDPDLTLPPLPGTVVELGGLVYQVFSIDATGRVILDVLEELPTNDEGETIH